TKNVIAQLQLDSRSQPPTNAPFDPSNPTTYNKQSPMSVYDTLGNPHTLTTYFVKDAAPNTWHVYTSMNGVDKSALDVAGVTQTNAGVVGARAAWESAPAAGKAAALTAYAASAAEAVRAEAVRVDPTMSAEAQQALLAAAN